MSGLAGFLIRVSAYLRKEVMGILRQPRLLATLILGPFLILLIFGLGYRNSSRVYRTLVLVPEESTLRPLVEDFADNVGGRVDVVTVLEDPERADRLLRRGAVDLVVAVPRDPRADVLDKNEHAEIRFFHNELDPFEVTFIEVFGERLVEEINKQVLLAAAVRGQAASGRWNDRLHSAREESSALMEAALNGEDGAAAGHAAAIQNNLLWLDAAAGAGLLLVGGLETEDASVEEISLWLEQLRQNVNQLAEFGANYQAVADSGLLEQIEGDLARLDELLTQFQTVDAEILVAPFSSSALNINAGQLEVTDFYVPSVIALLLQHTAVTLAALSIVRERQTAALELVRAAPVSAVETLLGKYLAYMLLTGAITFVLTALVLLVMGVPMLGAWWAYALVLGLLAFVSLGIGFIASLLARSDSQAIQFAMLVLLASVFFSGFFLPLYRLWEPVRALSWALPVTYGIDALQRIMLRGQPADPSFLLALGLMGIGAFVLAWWRFRAVLGNA